MQMTKSVPPSDRHPLAVILVAFLVECSTSLSQQALISLLSLQQLCITVFTTARTKIGGQVVLIARLGLFYFIFSTVNAFEKSTFFAR
jgi:hypothetical protein